MPQLFSTLNKWYNNIISTNIIIKMSGYLYAGINCTTKATGIITATAFVLDANATYHQISVTTLTDAAVRIPSNQNAGKTFHIRNDGVCALSVFPETGGTINDLVANSALEIKCGEVAVIVVGSGKASYTFNNNSASYNNHCFSLPAGNTTLTQADSGAIYSLNAAAAGVITLPDPRQSVGVRFTFINSIIKTGLVQIDGSVALLMSGNVICSNGSAAGLNVTNAACRSVNFIIGTLVGDWVSVISDGARWIVTGQSSLTNGLTLN
jgi:hypothetical protein